MSAEESPTRILVVEDEESLADTVRYNWSRGICGGRGPRRSTSAGAFRTRAALVILDLMRPEISGLDVCRQIRQISNVPIIMVTAKDSEADKVSGLELGADDYVTKPFSVRELVSGTSASPSSRHEGR